MNARATRAVLAALVAGAVSAACEAPEPPPPPAADAAAAFAAPPAVVAVAVADDGLEVRGLAGAGERVRLLAAGGDAHGATADESGRFAVRIPASGADQLFGLTVQRQGRAVPAEGWLYVPPGGAGSALVLRPGAPAAPLEGAPLLAAVDYDGGGGLAVSGRTAPGTAVRVLLDGVVAGETEADATGLYGVRLASPAAPGPHDIQVNAGGLRVERRLVLAAAPPDGVVGSAPMEGGWRVAWRPPGGGAQTTYVLTDADG